MTADHTLSIPETATSKEAAAIAAAISAHVTDQQRTRTDEAPDDSLKSWQFAGRMRALGKQCQQVPESAPTDPWTAADRSDRF